MKASVKNDEIKQGVQISRYRPTPKETVLMMIEGFGFIGQIVLCVLHYNFLGLDPLLYLGWLIFALAMVLGWRARVAFQEKGQAEASEGWIQTQVVVTTGVYAVVRHPMYLSFQLISLSLVFLSQHWLNALLGIVVMSLLYNDMLREEQRSLEKFGEDYRQYMLRVPRMNLVAGVLRQIRRVE